MKSFQTSRTKVYVCVKVSLRSHTITHLNYLGWWCGSSHRPDLPDSSSAVLDGLTWILKRSALPKTSSFPELLKAWTMWRILEEIKKKKKPSNLITSQWMMGKMGISPLECTQKVALRARHALARLCSLWVIYNVFCVGVWKMIESRCVNFSRGGAGCSGTGAAAVSVTHSQAVKALTDWNVELLQLQMRCKSIPWNTFLSILYMCFSPPYRFHVRSETHRNCELVVMWNGT